VTFRRQIFGNLLLNPSVCLFGRVAKNVRAGCLEAGHWDGNPPIFNRLLKKDFEALFSSSCLMPVTIHFCQLDERMRKSAPIGVIKGSLGLFKQPVNGAQGL